jgi:hypothetical protein
MFAIVCGGSNVSFKIRTCMTLMQNAPPLFCAESQIGKRLQRYATLAQIEICVTFAKAGGS